MPSYRVRFSTDLHVVVSVDAESKTEAVEVAGELADDYCQTLYGDNYVSTYASLDGIEPYEVEEAG